MPSTAQTPHAECDLAGDILSRGDAGAEESPKRIPWVLCRTARRGNQTDPLLLASEIETVPYRLRFLTAQVDSDRKGHRGHLSEMETTE